MHHFRTRHGWFSVLLLASVLGCTPTTPTPTGNTDAMDTGATAQAGPTERALSPSGLPYSEDRAPCADRDLNRQALWGELHVHSSLSMDAWLWDVRNGPDEVFAFAKGEETFLPPLNDAGAPTRPARPGKRQQRPVGRQLGVQFQQRPKLSTVGKPIRRLHCRRVRRPNVGALRRLRHRAGNAFAERSPLW